MRKFSLIGTAGQCLMIPPEGRGYDYPVVLYNLGGILTDLIVWVVVAVLAVFPLVGIYIIINAGSAAEGYAGSMVLCSGR